MRSLQVYRCAECLHRFTLGDAGKHKTYPLRAILETISTFNHGHSLRKRKQSSVATSMFTFPRTISSWIREFRELATCAIPRQTVSLLLAANDATGSSIANVSVLWPTLLVCGGQTLWV